MPSTGSDVLAYWRGTFSAWEQPRLSLFSRLGCLVCGLRTEQPRKGRPARIQILVVMTGILVESHSALGAQPLTVLTAHGLERQLRNDRIPQNRLEIDGIVLDAVLLVCFVFRRAFWCRFKNIELLNVSRNRKIDGIQTTAALPMYVHGGNTTDQDTIMNRFEAEIEPDVGTLGRSDQSIPEVLGRGHRLHESIHGPGTMGQVPDLDPQG